MTKIFLFALAAFLFLVGGCTQFDGVNGDDASTEPIKFEVVEFTPAPGQFVNSGYTATTMTEACEYAQQRIENRYFVSLGGFGGYIVVKATKSIANSGGYDFGIYGNAFDGSSEPGVVWVSQDLNGNGLADDEWFELYGSVSENDTTLRNYSITYSRTDDETRISWRDSEGESGVIERNSAHKQDYFPKWISEREYTLLGTLLPDNGEWSEINQEWVLYSLDWGYVDNFSAIDRSDDRANRFRISDARTASGEAANLTHIDFIKVQSAVNAIHSAIGETSTEVSGFIAYE